MRIDSPPHFPHLNRGNGRIGAQLKMPRRCVNTYGATDNCKELIGSMKNTSTPRLAAEFVAAARIDPHDRQSFKAFGTAPPGAEYLYRLYDDEMTLLYVGITWNPFVRWTAHSKKHAWWGQVAHADIHQCADNRSARDWETWCIKHLDPVYNKHQKRGWRP